MIIGLAFLIILIVLILLYIFVLRSIPLKILKKSFNAELTVKNQTGLFSFSSLNFKTSRLSLRIDKSKVSINPFALFTSRFDLLKVKIANVDINVLDISSLPKKQINTDENISTMKKSKPKANQFLQKILAQIVIYMIKCIEISIESIHFNIQDQIHVESSFSFSYKRKDHLEIQIGIGDTKTKIKNHDCSISKFDFSFDIELDIFQSLLFNQHIFLAKIDIPTFNIATTDKSITLPEGIFNVSFYPYSFLWKYTSITLQFNLPIPKAELTLKNLNISLQLPTKEIPHISVKELATSFEELNISIISEHFLNITNFEGYIESLRKPKFRVSINSILFNFSTLDGLQIFKLVKEFRKPVWTPLRIKFAFPEGTGQINSIKTKLHMTDLAIIEVHTTDLIKYEDKQLIMPRVTVLGNSEKLGNLQHFTISSPDEEYFTFSAKQLKLHDKHNIHIGWFLRNLIYGWYIIKPWASGKHYDSETIPFPIRIIVDKARLKIDDTPINSKLLALSSSIQSFLKEKSCMKYIFDSKIAKANLNAEQIKTAQEKLDSLYFQNYKDMTSKLSYHKYLLVLDLTNVEVKLDSRGLAPGMENLIYKFDPITQQLHSGTKWFTLEGIMINGSVGSCKLDVMNFKKPFVQGTDISLNGTLILGENTADTVPHKVTVSSQEFIVPGNVTDVKLYSDMKLSTGTVEWYFGGPLLKILDDIADAIIRLIPPTVLDPSPQLRWWDKLRAVFRGRYSVSLSTFITHIISGDDFREQDDNATLTLNNSLLNFSEGLIKIYSKTMDMTRMEHGPCVLHVPEFSTEVYLKWTTNGDNPHKHMVTPDVNQFSDPCYDSYNEFRATSYHCDVLVHFVNDMKQSPFISVDIAHLFWILEPLKNVAGGNPLNEVYQKKIHGEKPERRPDLYYFGKMPCTYKLSISNIPVFSLRTYDHFPVENNPINVSSVDISFANFTINSTLDRSNPELMDISASIESQSVLFNCTDLKYYARFQQELSPTVMEILDLNLNYSDHQIEANLSKIKIDINQFNFTYLKEYIEAVRHFLPNFNNNKEEPKAFIPRPKHENLKMLDLVRPSQNDNMANDSNFLDILLNRNSYEKIITTKRAEENRIMNQMNRSVLDDYPDDVLAITIPLIEITIESMQYDAQMIVSISPINITVNSDEFRNLYAFHALVDCLAIRSNSFTEIQNNQSELIKIQTIEFLYLQKQDLSISGSEIKGSIDFVSLNVSPYDIALIRHFIKETMPADQKAQDQSEKKKKKVNLEEIIEDASVPSISAMKISIKTCQGFIQDKHKTPIGSIHITEINYTSDQKSEEVVQNTILIKDVKINDIRPSTQYPQVCMRWVSQTELNVNSPLIRLQAKTSPPVGGIPIINHLEINLDPTVVNYEASFFSDLISLVLNKEVQRPRFVKMIPNYFSSPGICLSRVEVPANTLPEVADASKFMSENKSNVLTVQDDKTDDRMMLRYFKITSTKLNVSYHNSETKIPDVKEFNGLFHEIKYQDFNATIETLINKLVLDISADIIPQFLKHMIGLGRIQESEENVLKSWLQNDHDKQSDRQKLMLFGKKQKK